ncbi:MAG: AMP-binding protein [Acidimicrobiia bacterium]|nr:AMP-binding protein [Acidimicrobiia bacterium]
MALKATLRPTRAAHYLKPGGAWDGPSLDAVLAAKTPGAIAEQVASLAGGLRARGVRRGDAVAWQLHNIDQAMFLYRACWRLGAVAVPVHHGMGTADAATALAQVEPRVVLTEPEDVDGLIGEGRPVTAANSAARPADLAAALFTSGSTGTPKAVLHTQRGLAYKAQLMRDVHALTSDDAVLMPAPLAHISGLLNGVLLPGVAGMRTVLMQKWDPEEALRIIADEHITFMIGPPTFFVTLMAAKGFSPEAVRSIRLISSGGAGVTPAFVDQARDAFGATVKRTYGSTEAPTVTTSHAGDPLDRARDTDGRPTGEVELRINIQGAKGDAGELWVRGPELFVGYADPLQTRAAHARGGWFKTGDLATIDDDGWLTIVGRIKDVVIRGGENISVVEVEGVLEAHPAVRQAVVVGYPDDVLGERVAAFVVADGTFDLETTRSWFAERGVTRFKTPERVLQLDALPTLAAGKPDRTALRELARRG